MILTRSLRIELNDVKNLKKKFDFCDRPILQYTLNDSGKQITVHLNTVEYETFKEISASADGGPRSRVSAPETLRSAPHRH